MRVYPPPQGPVLNNSLTGILQLKMLNDLLLKYFAHDNHHCPQKLGQVLLNFQALIKKKKKGEGEEEAHLAAVPPGMKSVFYSIVN